MTVDIVNRISPLRAAVQQLRQQNHHWGYVRVPCDVQRADVSIAPWRNYAVKTDSVSTTAGLLQLLGGMRGIRARTGAVDTMPILADVDIFYRVLKLMLGETWAAYPVRQYLEGLPLLFGVWHGYKHAVKNCYQHFLPFWAALQYDTFLVDPTKAKSPRHPKLFEMEVVVTGLFLVSHDVAPMIEAKIRQFEQPCR